MPALPAQRLLPQIRATACQAVILITGSFAVLSPHRTCWRADLSEGKSCVPINHTTLCGTGGLWTLGS